MVCKKELKKILNIIINKEMNRRALYELIKNEWKSPKISRGLPINKIALEYFMVLIKFSQYFYGFLEVYVRLPRPLRKRESVLRLESS